MLNTEIKQNIDRVEQKVLDACRRAGRKREEVLLLAVSKTMPVDAIKEAMACGLYALGENKVQEIQEKYPQLDEKVQWHLIGHLQTNKVRYIIDKISLIHSVESLRLAQEIDKRAAAANVVMDILVEVNVVAESTKFGISVQETEAFIRTLAQMDHIRVRGLMTVAPFVDNAEDNRPIFKSLRNLLVDINNKKINNIKMDILSMGMSGDFEVAIEEGATIVRVGTSIFGKRTYISGA